LKIIPYFVNSRTTVVTWAVRVMTPLYVIGNDIDNFGI
jgi:hypothetical protein